MRERRRRRGVAWDDARGQEMSAAKGVGRVCAGGGSTEFREGVLCPLEKKKRNGRGEESGRVVRRGAGEAEGRGETTDGRLDVQGGRLYVVSAVGVVESGDADGIMGRAQQCLQQGMPQATAKGNGLQIPPIFRGLKTAMERIRWPSLVQSATQASYRTWVPQLRCR